MTVEGRQKCVEILIKDKAVVQFWGAQDIMQKFQM